MEQAYKEFANYVKNYNSEDPKIALKIKHTYSVVEKVKTICKSIQLNQEDTKLACLIALLHDIGRFEQVTRYHSFIDSKTVDHGDFGVQLLFEEGMIKQFCIDETVYPIIYKAIKNHNKFEIEPGLTKRELLHAKIIRDGDKVDNLELKCTLPFEDVFDKTKEEIEQQSVSDKVYTTLLQHQSVRSTDRNNELDMWMSHVGFVYDLYFPCSVIMINQEKYIETITNRLNYQDKETKKRIMIILEDVKNYMNKQLVESIYI